eukprot:jgi/Mesvir1/875/Mv26589-RA.1
MLERDREARREEGREEGRERGREEGRGKREEGSHEEWERGRQRSGTRQGRGQSVADGDERQVRPGGSSGEVDAHGDMGRRWELPRGAGGVGGSVLRARGGLPASVTGGRAAGVPEISEISEAGRGDEGQLEEWVMGRAGEEAEDQAEDRAEEQVQEWAGEATGAEVGGGSESERDFERRRQRRACSSLLPTPALPRHASSSSEGSEGSFDEEDGREREGEPLMPPGGSEGGLMGSQPPEGHCNVTEGPYDVPVVMADGGSGFPMGTTGMGEPADRVALSEQVVLVTGGGRGGSGYGGGGGGGHGGGDVGSGDGDDAFAGPAGGARAGGTSSPLMASANTTGSAAASKALDRRDTWHRLGLVLKYGFRSAMDHTEALCYLLFALQYLSSFSLLSLPYLLSLLLYALAVHPGPGPLFWRTALVYAELHLLALYLFQIPWDANCLSGMSAERQHAWAVFGLTYLDQGDSPGLFVTRILPLFLVYLATLVHCSAMASGQAVVPMLAYGGDKGEAGDGSSGGGKGGGGSNRDGDDKGECGDKGEGGQIGEGGYKWEGVNKGDGGADASRCQRGHGGKRGVLQGIGRGEGGLDAPSRVAASSGQVADGDKMHAQPGMVVNSKPLESAGEGRRVTWRGSAAGAPAAGAPLAGSSGPPVAHDRDVEKGLGGLAAAALSREDFAGGRRCGGGLESALGKEGQGHNAGSSYTSVRLPIREGEGERDDGSSHSQPWDGRRVRQKNYEREVAWHESTCLPRWGIALWSSLRRGPELTLEGTLFYLKSLFVGAEAPPYFIELTLDVWGVPDESLTPDRLEDELNVALEERLRMLASGNQRTPRGLPWRAGEAAQPHGWAAPAGGEAAQVTQQHGWRAGERAECQGAGREGKPWHIFHDEETERDHYRSEREKSRRGCETEDKDPRQVAGRSEASGGDVRPKRVVRLESIRRSPDSPHVAQVLFDLVDPGWLMEWERVKQLQRQRKQERQSKQLQQQAQPEQLAGRATSATTLISSSSLGARKIATKSQPSSSSGARNAPSASAMSSAAYSRTRSSGRELVRERYRQLSVTPASDMARIILALPCRSTARPHMPLVGGARPDRVSELEREGAVGTSGTHLMRLPRGMRVAGADRIAGQEGATFSRSAPLARVGHGHAADPRGSSASATGSAGVATSGPYGTTPGSSCGVPGEELGMGRQPSPFSLGPAASQASRLRGASPPYAPLPSAACGSTGPLRPSSLHPIPLDSDPYPPGVFVALSDMRSYSWSADPGVLATGHVVTGASDDRECASGHRGILAPDSAGAAAAAAARNAGQGSCVDGSDGDGHREESRGQPARESQLEEQPKSRDQGEGDSGWAQQVRGGECVLNIGLWPGQSTQGQLVDARSAESQGQVQEVGGAEMAAKAKAVASAKGKGVMVWESSGPPSRPVPLSSTSTRHAHRSSQELPSEGMYGQGDSAGQEVAGSLTQGAGGREGGMPSRGRDPLAGAGEKYGGSAGAGAGGGGSGGAGGDRMHGPDGGAPAIVAGGAATPAAAGGGSGGGASAAAAAAAGAGAGGSIGNAAADANTSAGGGASKPEALNPPPILSPAPSSPGVFPHPILSAVAGRHHERDLYTAIVGADMAAFVLLALYYQSLLHSGSGSLSQSYEANQFPVDYVYALIFMFSLMVADRVLYLTSAIRVKVLFHAACVALFTPVLAWLYWRPELEADRGLLRLFFGIKVASFALSALQIRFRYPTYGAIGRQFLMRAVSWFNYGGFLLYRALPFVYELRTVLDWACTPSALTLYDWFKLEDVCVSLFLVRCDARLSRERRRLGDKQPRHSKLLVGGGVFFLLLAALWLPLLLFSTGNPTNLPNPVTSVHMSISVQTDDGRFTLYEAGDRRQMLPAWPALHRVDPLREFEADQVQMVCGYPDGNTLWDLPPPMIRDLQALLNNDTYLVVSWSFGRERPLDRRETGFEVNWFGDVAGQLRGVMNGSLESATFQGLYDAMWDLPGQGAPRPLVSATRRDVEGGQLTLHGRAVESALQGETDASSDTNASGQQRPVAVTSDEGEHALWWSFERMSPNSSLPNGCGTNKGPRIVVVSEKVPGGFIGDALSGYGIAGLYLTFVLSVGRFLRIYVSDLRQRIPYENLPSADRLVALCDDIYAARAEGDIALEEALFWTLINIYRQPQALLEYTKKTE